MRSSFQCKLLAEVLEPRVVELYELVLSELRRSGMEDMIASGIVITGGSAMMRGMMELGEEIFHMPVRLGLPRYVGGLSEVVSNPRYATGVGLVLMGKQQVEKHLNDGAIRYWFIWTDFRKNEALGTR